MKTLKLVIDTSELDGLRKAQSVLIRRAYKMAEKGFGQGQVYTRLSKESPLDRFLIQCAVQKGADLFKIHGSGVVFGGKKNLKRRAKGLISNLEWKRLRLQPLYRVGQAQNKGNRRFRFDLDRNALVYKDSGNEIQLGLPKLRPNYQGLLRELSKLAESKQIALTFSAGDGFVCIQYDETKIPSLRDKHPTYTPIAGRVLGIDLNPNRIGIAVRDRYGKLIYARQYEFDTSISQHKRQYEISRIAEDLSKILQRFRVESVRMEDLSVKQKNHGSRRLNKTINFWIRNFIIAKVRSICSLRGTEFKQINPAYSSFIGTLLHPDLGDCMGAAVEIARRGRYQYQKGYFYPKLITMRELEHRWKEMAGFRYETWVELYREFKNRQLRWRSPPVHVRSSVFESTKSGITRLVTQRK